MIRSPTLALFTCSPPTPTPQGLPKKNAGRTKWGWKRMAGCAYCLVCLQDSVCVEVHNCEGTSDSVCVCGGGMCVWVHGCVHVSHARLDVCVPVSVAQVCLGPGVHVTKQDNAGLCLAGSCPGAEMLPPTLTPTRPCSTLAHSSLPEAFYNLLPSCLEQARVWGEHVAHMDTQSNAGPSTQLPPASCPPPPGSHPPTALPHTHTVAAASLAVITPTQQQVGGNKSMPRTSCGSPPSPSRPSPTSLPPAPSPLMPCQGRVGGRGASSPSARQNTSPWCCLGQATRKPGFLSQNWRSVAPQPGCLGSHASAGLGVDARTPGPPFSKFPSG